MGPNRRLGTGNCPWRRDWYRGRVWVIAKKVSVGGRKKQLEKQGGYQLVNGRGLSRTGKAMGQKDGCGLGRGGYP